MVTTSAPRLAPPSPQRSDAEQTPTVAHVVDTLASLRLAYEDLVEQCARRVQIPDLVLRRAIADAILSRSSMGSIHG